MASTLRPQTRKTLVSGTVAGLLSLAALAVLGRRELSCAAAPVNAPSHWVWGDDALTQRRWSWRYSGLGIVIHQASSVWWAWLHHRRHPSPHGPLHDAVVTTAAAAVVDLALTPKRFTPGFERHLSPLGLALVYGAFAVGLAIACKGSPAASSTPVRTRRPHRPARPPA